MIQNFYTKYGKFLEICKLLSKYLTPIFINSYTFDSQPCGLRVKSIGVLV